MSEPPERSATELIETHARLAATPAHELAVACLASGIAAAQPDRLVARRSAVADDELRLSGLDATARVSLDDYTEIRIVGGGKAAAGLTRGLVDRLGDRVDGGRVVTTGETGRIGPVEVVAGGHPTPTDAGITATEETLAALDRAGAETLVLAPITGGGSAALAAPADGVEPATLRTVTRRLLTAGAAVEELNAVRRRLSAVKGGRLAVRTAPGTVIGLLVSDVVGDRSVIASGPTVPDPTTAPDALAVLDRYGIDEPAVRAAVVANDTPPADHPAFERSRSVVLGDGRTALRAARRTAREAGCDARIVSDRVTGEARRRGRVAAALGVAVAEQSDARDEQTDTDQTDTDEKDGDSTGEADGTTVLLTGGETTVTVTGDGRGGPNCEYVLAAGAWLARQAADCRVVVGAVDTDGADGSTTVAGGVIDGTTIDPAQARRALADNDASTALTARDAAVVTGPTGTNVDDLRVIVVTPEQ